MNFTGLAYLRLLIYELKSEYVTKENEIERKLTSMKIIVKIFR